MARLAFLLMAHRDAGRLIAQVEALIHHGDHVAIHWDARANEADWREIKLAFGSNPQVAFAPRVRCGWGEFSLVQATLNLMQTARAAFTGVTHYYLISGDCYPTKERDFFDRFLEEDKDHIEINDFFESNWIRTGLKEERLIYRHWFNERARKWLFYTSLNWQRKLGLARTTPDGVKIQIGSQWWVLRASTVERILSLLKKRRDIVRFFRTTWIPDEVFFHTLVAHLVSRDEIESHAPTHLRFSDYGMPVVFHGDHLDYLRSQPRLFARKVSPHGGVLQDKLLNTFRSPECARQISGRHSQLYAYLSDRGRKGQRYAFRFWERAIADRKRADLMIIVAKLWHVGEAIEKKSVELSGAPGLGFVFDEDRDLQVPLGGLEAGLEKRSRHRSALLNLVYDALDTERLILCLDPSRINVLEEFVRKIGTVRILLVDRPVSPAHIRSHALRSGLLAADSGQFEEREVMRALTSDFTIETEQIIDRFADRLYHNHLNRTREENILDLGHFLQVGRGQAEALAREAERHKS